MNHNNWLKRVAFATFATFTALSFSAKADLAKVKDSGVLKVAVYHDFAPFSEGRTKTTGIDVDIAEALAKKLGVKLSLLPFDAGENVNDDLRNMVWKGHYLGYGPADVMLHVPVDPIVINTNRQVTIFAPYYRETVIMALNTKRIPNFANFNDLVDKRNTKMRIRFFILFLNYK